MLDDVDLSAVIRGLRDGRREAWNSLYDRYSEDVWRYVARLVGTSPVDVADVVQETFLSAARGAHQFDITKGTLWGWLTGIAHHHASLYWRQIGKRHRLFELAQQGAGSLRRWIDDVDPASHSWENNELTDLVRATLASIASDYAILLTTKYLDELSLEEITAQLGGSVDATKSKMARARREFRTKFEQLTKDNQSHDASRTNK